MKTFTLAVSTYNEHQRNNYQWLRECLEPASTNDAVSDIMICDDGSDQQAELASVVKEFPKTQVMPFGTNEGVFATKIASVRWSNDRWAAMCDSDNVMDDMYIQRVLGLESWDPDCMYAASRAGEVFDYTDFCGTWDAAGFIELVKKNSPMFWCLANTGNCFVHVNTFCDVFSAVPTHRFDLSQPNYFGVEDRQDIYWRKVYDALDSFFIMKKWLMAGKKLCVVPDLKYHHRVGHADLGNYWRSPTEKDALGPVYFIELHDFVNGIKTPQNYRYHSTYNCDSQGNPTTSCVYSSGPLGNGRASVDMNTGQVCKWSVQ